MVMETQCQTLKKNLQKQQQLVKLRLLRNKFEERQHTQRLYITLQDLENINPQAVGKEVNE